MSKTDEKKSNPKKPLTKKPKKVIQKHEGQLEMKLGQLWYQGYTVIERYELLSWFKQEKITKLIWAEINDLWITEFDELKQYPLQVLKCDEATPAQKFVLIHKNSDYLVDIEEA